MEGRLRIFSGKSSRDIRNIYTCGFVCLVQI